MSSLVLGGKVPGLPGSRGSVVSIIISAVVENIWSWSVPWPIHSRPGCSVGSTAILLGSTVILLGSKSG